ncbi:MAG: DUF1844 domain-containing protein [Deltaproteobacteria bacterium]|nr:DUF1844 domain-containing protein [Deltaproteobacteria bacterium]
MEEDKKEKGFVIKDKRLFDESGDVRQEEPKKAEETAPDQKNESPAEKTVREEGQEAQAEEHYPDVNFASFVLSLSTSAMYHFGDFPDPVSKQSERNLPAAKQTIDLLSMLKDKTAGNLDEGEKSLIDGLLFELRLRYVKEKAKE